MEAPDDTVVRLYELARECRLEDFQERVLALLKTRVPFDSAIWGTGMFTPGGLVYHSVHLHNEPGELASAYEDVRQQDDAASRLRERHCATQRFHAPTLYRAKNKAPIRDYAVRFGHQNYIVASEQRESGAVNWLALYRRDPDAQYMESDRNLIHCLAPHLRESFRVSCALHMHSLEAGSRRHCAAVFDAQGIAIHAEHAFQELLEAEWPGAHADRLPSPLLDALASGAPSFAGRVMMARWERVNSLIFVRARPRMAVDALTLRERSIAEHIARGDTHKEIARALAISPATVRNHTQRIHAKLGVRTNAELAHCLNGA